MAAAAARLVVISGDHEGGRRFLASTVANSISATLLSSEDIASAMPGRPGSVASVLTTLAARQIEREHSVVVEVAGSAGDILGVLERTALLNGAKFAPIVCFDGLNDPSPQEMTEAEMEAAAIEAEVAGLLACSAESGSQGLVVDTSQADGQAVRDVVGYLQFLDGFAMLSVPDCRFCDHEALRRRSVSVLQNEWCMLSVERIEGRLVGAVTPLRHVSSVFDLTTSEWAATGSLLRSGLRHLDRELRPTSYVVGWNVRSKDGDGPPHTQLRIVPSYAPPQSWDASEVGPVSRRALTPPF